MGVICKLESLVHLDVEFGINAINPEFNSELRNSYWDKTSWNLFMMHMQKYADCRAQ